MAIKSKDVYKGRKKSKARPWIIVGVIVLLLLIIIGVFYGLRSLCVYDEAGNATIIFPWEERPEQTVEPTRSAAPDESEERDETAEPEEGETGEQAPPEDEGETAAPSETGETTPESGEENSRGEPQ